MLFQSLIILLLHLVHHRVLRGPPIILNPKSPARCSFPDSNIPSPNNAIETTVKIPPITWTTPNIGFTTLWIKFTNGVESFSGVPFKLSGFKSSIKVFPVISVSIVLSLDFFVVFFDAAKLE